MIDVDERGRAAAADLNRAAAAAADTDAAWRSLLAGDVVPVRAPARPRHRVRWVAAAVGAAAAATIAVVALTVTDRTGAPGGLRTTSPAGPESSAGPSLSPTDPGSSSGSGTPTPTTAASGSTPAPHAETVPPPATSSAVEAALSSVATADVLPAVVSVSRESLVELAVDGVPVAIPAYTPWFAVQAPDGRLVITPGGDAFGNNLVYDPATGASTQVPEPAVDDMRVNFVGDVATLGGVPTVIANRADPCNTEGAPCSRSETVLLALDGGHEPRTIVGTGGATLDGEQLTIAGRLSLSDTGLLAGMAWLSGTEQVGLLVDTTADGGVFGSDATALGRALGLNARVDDPSRRIDAVTIDQSGRAVAWLAADELTVVDVVTGERRTFALPSLPSTEENLLPLLDLALTGSGIGDGAVLVSSMAGGSARIVDLSDGSVEAVGGFTGALTFSAASSGSGQPRR